MAAVKPAVNLALVAGPAKALGQFAVGDVEGGELVLRVGFGTNDVSSPVDGQLDLILGAGLPGVLDASDFYDNFGGLMQQMIHL